MTLSREASFGGPEGRRIMKAETLCDIISTNPGQRRKKAIQILETIFPMTKESIPHLKAMADLIRQMASALMGDSACDNTPTWHAEWEECLMRFQVSEFYSLYWCMTYLVKLD